MYRTVKDIPTHKTPIILVMRQTLKKLNKNSGIPISANGNNMYV
jgi:hypothetical protein